MIKQLEFFKESPEAIALYVEGIRKLESSGVFNVLREMGRVSAVDPKQPNYMHEAAMAAENSIGFNTALDCVQYFREMFITVPKPKQAPTPDYGATEALLASGDFTEEEVNAIRLGTELPKLESGRFPGKPSTRPSGAGS